MIINKLSGKNDTELMAQKYVEWLNCGVSPDEILVLTFNSNSKKNILKSILNLTKNKTLSDIKIYTLNGLFYNSVSDNWGMLENKLSDNNTKILPNLSGLEISQFILKKIIKEEEVKGYNSKKSLLHQIFRRYSLIVNNNLSPKEVLKKMSILGEAYGKDAQKIIKNFQLKTIDLRAFDTIRQAQIFSYIFKNSKYFKNIKYLITEDTDEYNPLVLEFIKSISPQLKDKYILFDKDGGSRCGFLCAEPNVQQKLEEIFNEEIIDGSTSCEDILLLKDNILNDKKNALENVRIYSLSKRLDMVEKAVNITDDLIKNGVLPKDITIITPIQDNLLKYTLNSGLKRCNPLFISGNEKLADNPLIKSVLSVLKLSVNLSVDEYELRTIISKYINIPIKSAKPILDEYKKTKKLTPVELEYPLYTNNLKIFCALTEQLKSSTLSLSEKAYFTYTHLIKTTNKYDLAKFNFLLKELQDFEKIFKNESIENFEEEIITQIENSIISENPYSTLETDDKDLIISTPQKIIDNKIRTKYQIWLDTSSPEWIKPDNGPLYNSWVFQKSWDKDEYTLEDNIRLSKEKTFKILRKLFLNSEKIITLSSLFDTQGNENTGGIEKYLITKSLDKNSLKKSNNFKIVPRKDQEPVLEYKKGKMAITAVPGAGKTTILLALIIKLMENGVNPENIYVLTYMESAARNFKDKIKGVNEGINEEVNRGTNGDTGDMNSIPNISTIHGLALRILKENSNFERLGLNSEFEICDDTKRGTILNSLGFTKNETSEFEKAISTLKLSGANINPEENNQILELLNMKNDKNKLSKFIKFFFNYQKKLANENLIDYDDILISAVKLLEENEDISEYYQNICKYIIEDEAQDSSYIQQRLINILCEKHKNLIRCGDINQAITTTFTNADVEGFKEFIKNSKKVDMNCSQRCSKDVWELANRLVKYGNENYNKPFYEIYMNPVEGKNPPEKNGVHHKIYSSSKEEKIEVVKEIKTILSKTPDATIGILLRNNHQVNTWANYLNNSGLNTITRNECLGQKKIFKVIYSILKFISEPFDNLVLAEAYKTLSECGFFRLHLDKIISNLNDELRGNYTDFITLKNDEIKDSDLARFHWDMNYWLSFPELSIDELAIKIGLNYFSESIEKSNIHLISTLCSKINTGTFAQNIKRLEDLSQRPTLSGLKFFSEDEEQDMTKGKVQVMTMHKSKGDEFDYVFIPEMSEKNLTLDIKSFNLKKSSDFMESVKCLNKNYKKKTDNELKEFMINENFRLLYVAITRAKKRLFITTSQTELSFGKEKESIPSIIFDELLFENSPCL